MCDTLTVIGWLGNKVSRHQARSQGRKSDKARPGGRAEMSEIPKFLRIFGDKIFFLEKTDDATASSASCWLRAWTWLPFTLQCFRKH